MSNYFDFHYHPMFKKFISDYEDNYPSTRTPAQLTPGIVPDNDIMNMIDRGVLHILGSQCSFDQLTKAHENLGVANIVTLEYAIASASNIFGDILRSRIVAPLDRKYFDKVGDGKISYYHLFIKELNLYGILANIGSSKKAGVNGLIKILARSKNKLAAFDTYKGTTLALAMEGGHNLNRNLVNNSPADLDVIPDPGKTDNIYADFYNNANNVLTPAQSLVHLFNAMWLEEMDLLYVTLTHLTYIKEIPLATHGYGMKFLKHNYFYPAGNGLTDAGKAVISAAYEMKIGDRKTPVLIDIKHMSLKSRLDFYTYRKQKGYTLPVLATHMGVTGCSINEWINVEGNDNNGKTTIAAPLIIAGMDNSGDVNPTKYHFNPWTINLMDEDIIEILNSNGMIGVSLDRRIVGVIATDENVEYNSTEYLSTDEFNFLKANYEPTESDDIDIDPDTDVQIDPEGIINDWDRDNLRQIACLAFNIIHILAIGLTKTAINPWSHIVIGSDYDGLIEPISLADYCTDLDKYGVEELLSDLMPSVESSYLHFHPIPQGTILPRNADGSVNTDDLQNKIRDIMFNNGANFLKLWYTYSL